MCFAIDIARYSQLYSDYSPHDSNADRILTDLLSPIVTDLYYYYYE
jgi:hypothetical protein